MTRNPNEVAAAVEMVEVAARHRLPIEEAMRVSKVHGRHHFLSWLARVRPALVSVWGGQPSRVVRAGGPGADSGQRRVGA
jgi:hypothetical protein